MHAVLYSLETLKSPDGKFTLTTGSDCHTCIKGLEDHNDWQQVNEYVMHKKKHAKHSIIAENPFPEVMKFLPLPTANRRTGNFIQDALITPVALALNKVFGTTLPIPPENRGFLSNLQKKCLDKDLNIECFDFRTISRPQFKTQDFLKIFNMVVKSLNLSHEICKEKLNISFVTDIDLRSIEKLKMLIEKYQHPDKTMADVYANKTPIYTSTEYGYAERSGDSLNPEYFTDETLSKLLDITTILTIHEHKYKGKKMLDLFMGGMHIKNIIARLKAQGWRTIKKESQHDQAFDEQGNFRKNFVKTVKPSNVGAYFNELQAQKREFIGGIPLSTVAATWHFKLLKKST
jgi:hypothetical protein